MTLRELLEKLKAIDEKSLDRQVMVTPAAPDGGYEPIRDVSVLYAGIPVIHFGNDGSKEAEEKAQLEEGQKLLWGADAATGDGLVAAVEPDDLRKFWNLGRDLKASLPDPEAGFAISVEVFKNACGPEADLAAVWYRVSMLQLLCGPMGLFSTRLHNGELDDSVLKIAATIPMKRMDLGTVQEGMPFDVEEFVKQVEQTAGG